MLAAIRKSKAARIISAYLALSFLTEIIFPASAFALTGGPSQPEVQSFEPIGTSEMVDLFSGDYNYNIPLMDVGGYPINISYHSGITMDQEASWVGLAWNINAGVINRNMRGIPDDFKGDVIQKEFNTKPNRTFGVNTGIGTEIFGLDKFKARLGFSLGIAYNNYSGISFEKTLTPSFSAGDKAKGTLNFGLGIKGSDEGLTLSPNLSFDSKTKGKEKGDLFLGASVGSSINSRSGMKQLSIGVSAERGNTQTIDDKTSNIHRGDKGYESISGDLGSSFSFGMPTYTPQQSLPMINTSVSLSVKFGITGFGVHSSGNLGGYYSSQRLARTSDEIPAYGYLNAGLGSQLQKVALDFNREKDGAFSKNTPDLPLTNFTYDIYSVSGQGVGGMYRPFRGDIGHVFDPYVQGGSDSYSLGLELGGGNLAYAGSELVVNDVTTVTSKWQDDNVAANKLKFRDAIQDSLLYESYYFKEAGERSVDADNDLLASIGGYDPVKVNLKYTGGMTIKGDGTFTQQLSPQSSTQRNIPDRNYRRSRQKRNQAISLLTKSEIQKFGLDNYTSSNAKDYHIAEVNTLRPDGSRYVYGIPAYNSRQEECSFSLGNQAVSNLNTSADCNIGLIGYTPDKDNSVNNEMGVDNYYNNVVLPAYAHSYLLTSVLSPDYADIDNIRGPSKGDVGSYTKFKYSKINNFKWRVPVEANKANFNEGLKTDGTDDQGNYLYGEKEIWYLDTIETKNYIAIFTKENREDGYGVLGRNGGIDTLVPLKLLRKISLYSKPEYDANPSVAVPIKEVHFEYDYSLCPGIPNSKNSGGKLTLKSIFFTYGKSKRGKLSPYTFYYREDIPVNNPSYNLKGYDRWGNYKPNTASDTCGYSPSRPLATYDYPYVDQDKTLADQYTSVWTLTKIDLPSGGSINITYEAKDYAYVQNKQAMQMFKITGIGANSTYTTSSSLFGASPNNYIFFKLQDDIPNDANATKTLTSQYLKGIRDLYFHCLVNVNQNGNEFVSGYAKVDDNNPIGGASDGSHPGYYTHGWIKVESVKTDKNSFSSDANPISKVAWQFARLHTPWAYNYATPDPKLSIRQTLEKLADAGLIKNIIDAFHGPNGALKSYGYGSNAVTGKSWVRLLNPNKKKLGGGCRVKEIKISDEWSTMQAGQNTTNSNYGQVYDYTTVEDGKVISSGVAAYEPMLGGDENPFRQPVPFGNNEKWYENLLAPHNDNYLEEPFGESFFPSPTVGYSKVTVKNLQYANVKRNATGSVVHEFYTAKDFPTLVRKTDLDIKPKKTNPILSLFKISVKDYMTASEGYAVELNDMHGKPKMQSVYAEGQKDLISSVEYRYKRDGGRLNNEVNVINKNGTIETKTVGVDYDMVADMRQQETETTSVGMSGNLASFLAGIFPAIVPAFLPTFSSERTRFRSSVVTKVVQRYGILEETIATDLGSKVSTSNLAYDAETGEVLVTKTKNDFEDEVYSFTYPAHWAYDRMGPAYKNIGVKVTASIASTGVATISGSQPASRYFVTGDELSVDNNQKAWVTAVSGSTITLIKDNGFPFSSTGTKTLKVIRSGRRNQHSTPVGTFTSLVNPIDHDGNGVVDLVFTSPSELLNILNAGAVEFSEDWKTFCDCLTIPGGGEGEGESGSVPGTNNPFLLGNKGNWRAKRSYLYLTERLQSNRNQNTFVRKDGIFKNFNAFWTANNGNDWNKNTSNWTFTSEVTQFSPYGFELENKDALNRFSAAIYGYNNSLPTAVASNSQYRESGFDNFEDYSFGTCTNDHFSFKPYSSNVVDTLSHTGRKSIRVGNSSSVIITKSIENCSDE